MGPPGRSLFLFAVPSLLVLSLVLVYPLGYALYLSLFDYYLANPDRTFIGLGNYAELLSERRFWWSMLNTADHRRDRGRHRVRPRLRAGTLPVPPDLVAQDASWC